MIEAESAQPSWADFVDDSDLQSRLSFLTECDALKSVLRMSNVVDGSRRENAAEHSWHVALMAMVLAPHAGADIDVGRVIRMLLVHDLVEIDAGDTYCYDDVGHLDKKAREDVAAARLFRLLPGEQANELRDLWDEFEARQTAESCFANAIDRCQPILLNLSNSGRLWTDNAISATQIRTKNRHVGEGSGELWQMVERIVEYAESSGWLRDDGERPASLARESN